MTHRESELQRITTLLGQCLGRIDEQAFRLQAMDDEDDDFDACDVVDRETSALQELLDAVTREAVGGEDADLNQMVERALRSCTTELGIPIVIRQNLAARLPRVACATNQLAFAVQRALTLSLGSLEAGDEIRVGTRVEQDTVLLEIESPARDGDAHLDERAQTLTEFVVSLRGSCRIDTHERSCLIALELPASLVADG